MTKNSKISWYAPANFDEKQLIDRYKISFETMWLIIILISVNGMIKIVYGAWAVASTEMAILLFPPMIYFVTRSIMKNAYFSISQKSHTSLVMFVFISVLYISIFIITLMDGESIIENGMLSGNLSYLFMGLSFLFISVVYLIKNVMNRAVKEDEE